MRHTDPVLGYDDRTAAPKVVEARTAEGRAESAIAAFRAELMDKRRAEFLAAGGCARCDGHGTVVAWSTLDSVSGCYDQFGPCPDCSSESKRTITRWPGMNAGRLSGHPHVLELPPLVQTPDEARRLTDLEENARLASLDLHAAERLYVLARGCRVEVVKGRKVKVGSVGVVVWTGDSAYGERVGIVVDGTPKGPDGKAPAVFTSADNVVVIEPSAAHRERVEQRLPTLDGTPKQVAWADRIRAAAIKAGKITLDAARDLYSARYYIDNRDRLAA